MSLVKYDHLFFTKSSGKYHEIFIKDLLQIFVSLINYVLSVLQNIKAQAHSDWLKNVFENRFCILIVRCIQVWVLLGHPDRNMF